MKYQNLLRHTGKVTFAMLLLIGLNATLTYAADSCSYLLWTKQGVPCSDDTITETSLNNAFSAIASGVLNVSLSPNGCIRYIQQLSGSTVTSERFTLAGQDTIVWTHTGDQSSGREDVNFDGFFEKRTTIDRTPNQERIEFVTYSQSPQMIIERITHTRNGEMFHVIWEKYLDATGELTILSEYDTPRYEYEYIEEMDLVSPITNTASTSSLAVAKSGCTLQQLDQLENLFMEALRKGNECMAKHGRPDIGLSVIQAVLPNRYSHQWECTTIRDPFDTKAIAFIELGSWFSSEINITVNDNPDGRCTCDDSDPQCMCCGCNFWALSHEEQLNIMFHELLHATLPDHDNKMLESIGNATAQFDRIYACAGLCFPRAPYDHNPCACATCLETKTCDKRCSVKPGTCSPVLSQCQCGSNKGKYYLSSDYCNVVCPSGLFCFGTRCVVTHSLMCEY